MIHGAAATSLPLAMLWLHFIESDMRNRIVCHFSCGAASAVAAKLAIEENARGTQLPLIVLNEYVKQEHPDNARFLKECEAWFGVPILVVQNEKYHGDIYEAFEGEKYIAGVYGAVCTRTLKKEVAAEFWRYGDVDVIGYTAEEQDRHDDWIDANNERRSMAILIDRGLTKEDCKAIVMRAGIALPAMYDLGYEHNNCIGCVKAGMGYWNKIRIDFPAEFTRMAEYSRSKGVKLLKRKEIRIYLDELQPGDGDFKTEPQVQCGIFCEMAEKEIAA
jgi:3'-phosphoadenosine 5'-phosphosulfate sulfotransferase (PAPS reductase)/FAD synthetase